MKTEENIERLLRRGEEAYKKSFRKYCPLVGRKLDRHEDVELNGIFYRYWRELVVHNIGNLVQEYCPDSEVSVVIDGNDSELYADLTAEDEETLNKKIDSMMGSGT